MNRPIDIYIQGKRLDLFEDENFVLNSSVQNVNDISKLFTDYSQGFTVPASRNNNVIFKHYYNADINDGFDARTKKDSYIEIGKLPFKLGKMVLESVNMKNGTAESYSVTFYGNLVNLTDLFSEDFLSDLNWLEYDHVYDFDTVKDGLINGLNNEELIYPMISSSRQWFYSSSTVDHTDTETLVNIAHHAGDVSPFHGIDWTELKPALKVSAIIDKIEETYGINFSNDFFGTPVFNNLYLWLSNSKGRLFENEQTGVQVVNFDSHNSGDTIFDLVTDSYTTTLVSNTGSSVNTGTQRVTGSFTVTPQSGYNDISYSHYRQNSINGTVNPQEENITGATTYGFINRVLQNGTIDQRISFYIEAESFMVYDTLLTIRKQQWNGSSWDTLEEETVTGNSSSTTDQLSLKTIFSTLKVKDFMSSIVKMYNLVIVPNNSTDFYVDTLDNWYGNGSIYDITQFVDTSDHTISKANIFNNINFYFQDDETILIDEFTNFNGYQYGNLETDIKDNNGEILTGKSLDIGVEFGNMIFERLNDELTGNPTNIQYGTAIDSNLDPINPSPLLFYAIKQDLDSAIFIKNTDSTGTSNTGTVYMPSHVNSFTSKDYSTVFNAELNEFDTTLITDSLYKLYYEDYITDVLSEKRRMYTYRAELPNLLISKIKLNDRILIKDTRYIINNMEINLTKNRVDFELFNDIYEVQIPSIPSLQAVTLGRDATNGQTACSNYSNGLTSTYYIPADETFATATKLLLANDEQTDFFASNGMYSNGSIVRQWTSPSFTSTNNCSTGGGGTPNPKSFDMSATGSSSTTTACSLSTNTTKYWEGTEAQPTLADIIYNESTLSTTFNGGNNYFKIANTRIIRITSNGVITDVFQCGGGSQ